MSSVGKNSLVEMTVAIKCELKKLNHTTGQFEAIEGETVYPLPGLTITSLATPTPEQIVKAMSKFRIELERGGYATSTKKRIYGALIEVPDADGGHTEFVELATVSQI